MRAQSDVGRNTLSGGQGGNTLQAEGTAGEGTVGAGGARSAFGEPQLFRYDRCPSVRDDTAGGKSEKA